VRVAVARVRVVVVSSGGNREFLQDGVSAGVLREGQDGRNSLE
jgi:hypothetical protein